MTGVTFCARSNPIYHCRKQLYEYIIHQRDNNTFTQYFHGVFFLCVCYIIVARYKVKWYSNIQYSSHVIKMTTLRILYVVVASSSVGNHKFDIFLNWKFFTFAFKVSQRFIYKSQKKSFSVNSFFACLFKINKRYTIDLHTLQASIYWYSLTLHNTVCVENPNK